MVQPPSDVPDLVLRGRLVSEGAVVADGMVAIAGERIVWAGPARDAPAATWPVPHAAGSTLLPGLIDLHCHGGAGHSFPDGDVEGSRTAARHHLLHGTTGLVASLVTATQPAMINAVAATVGLVADGTLLGVHLEGPFLSPMRCGAQDPASMLSPDLGVLDHLLDAGQGHVVSMTYAAELDGTAALVDRLGSRGVIPSLGHTDAGFAAAAASLSSASGVARTGRASVTHLFNGMRPFHHRDPGPAAAALAAAGRGEAVVELVADGVHLDDATAGFVLGLVGAGSVALVTDAMAGAGIADGTYHLGTRTVVVLDGIARLAGEDGAPGAIAGGTTCLLDVVRRCVHLAGVDLAVAVEAATATPARLLGIEAERGALRAGLRADVVAVDDELRPVAVWSAGRPGGLIGTDLN